MAMARENRSGANRPIQYSYRGTCGKLYFEMQNRLANIDDSQVGPFRCFYALVGILQ